MYITTTETEIKVLAAKSSTTLVKLLHVTVCNKFCKSYKPFSGYNFFILKTFITLAKPNVDSTLT